METVDWDDFAAEFGSNSDDNKTDLSDSDRTRNEDDVEKWDVQIDYVKLRDCFRRIKEVASEHGTKEGSLLGRLEDIAKNVPDW